MAAPDTTTVMSSLTAASASSAAVATTVQFVTVTMVALTTTFTPPATCAEMHLTQLSWPAFEIWANEPQPVPGTKFGACYPSQFIDGYTSLGNASSSVAPVFSPLICPQGWHAARTWENGYIACCAADYQLGVPPTPSDPNRPAYGGTCYSAFPQGVTVNVTQFDTESLTATATFYASTNTDRAYAHPIDGFRLEPEKPTGGRLSGAAIAGIVLSILCGLSAMVLCLGCCFYRWRRSRPAAAADGDHSAAGDAPGDRTGIPNHGGAQSNVDAAAELSKDPAGSPWTPAAVETAGTPLHEIDTSPIGELDGGWRGDEMQASSKERR